MSDLLLDGSMVAEGQSWRDLPTPGLGTWEPRLRVCVVLPARDCQDELDRTLASLAAQSYPADLFETVVVDDASTVPLRLPKLRPEHTRIVRIDEIQEHGSGRARHRGAQETTADVIEFLDADMVVDRYHVEAHARWHHVTPHAVVLARKWFVDFNEVSPTDVYEATARRGIEDLLSDRTMQKHKWQEDYIKERDELTRDVSDAFVAVVGASISIRREMYVSTGGFSQFGLRGIVDTEFGYRAFTAGGLLVPDWEAVAYHQGLRSFKKGGDEIKRTRTGLAANYLPIDLFRPSNSGRIWAVPKVHVIVDVGNATPEEVQVTTDNVLASDFTDVTVTISSAEDVEIPQWLLDYFSHEQRVTFVHTPVSSGFPSPTSVVVSAGLVMDRGSLGAAVRESGGQRSGVVRLNPDDVDGLSFEIWTTRALLRSIDRSAADIDSSASKLFGEKWISAEELGMRRAEYRVTKQGMITV